MTKPKLFSNGNTWPSVITILLTLNLAIMGYLAVRVDNLYQISKNTSDVALKNSIDISNGKTQYRYFLEHLNDDFAKKEWVRKYFVEK